MVGVPGSQSGEVPMIKAIPLNKLFQSPRNVRRHAEAAADVELKASIAAHGLLQNLIVRPAAKGKFEVEAGERRRRAMLALVTDRLLPRDHAVTCLVLEDADEAAVETSLAENFHRLAMNPADEAQAFASLVESGASSEDVARRFGLTVRFVEGRLRLARLAPIVFEALASGEITLDMAKAFGATSDQEIQARVFEQVTSAYYAPSPDSIRRMVLSGTVRGSDPRARLVGRDAYVAAGGRIERELFDDDDSESWVDVALLESLAQARMEEHARAVAAEQGLAWVKPTLDTYASHDLVSGLARLPAEPAPLTEAEIARLDELDASYDEHAAILEDEESAEEAVAAAEAAIEAIEHECQDIRNRPPVLAPELKAEAGMILTLSRDGTPVLQPVFYGEHEDGAEAGDDAIEVVAGDGGDARTSWRSCAGSIVSAPHSTSSLPSSAAASSRKGGSRHASSRRCSRACSPTAAASAATIACIVPARTSPFRCRRAGRSLPWSAETSGSSTPTPPRSGRRWPGPRRTLPRHEWRCADGNGQSPPAISSSACFSTTPTATRSPTPIFTRWSPM